MRKYVVASIALLPLLLTFSQAEQTWSVDSPGQPFAYSSEDSGTSSYLGVDISDVTTERLSALKLKEEKGVEVTMVDQDAPAGKAGIKEHDVILTMNGTSIESGAQLRRMIHEMPPGRIVSFGLSRDGQPVTVKVQLADKKKELFDGDIEALVLRAEGSDHGPWSLINLEVNSQLGSAATAMVRLQHADGRALTCQSSGDGPVDAAYKAIEQATGLVVKVRKFEVHAVTVGEDAQGETVIHVDYNNRSYRGSSVSTDIIEASCKALLEVINRIVQSQQGGARLASREAAAQADGAAAPASSAAALASSAAALAGSK